jgi:hypothetical protein
MGVNLIQTSIPRTYLAMRTLHAPAPLGVQMSSRILLEIDIFEPRDSETQNRTAHELHSILEEHLTPEVLTALGRLLHNAHPS